MSKSIHYSLVLVEKVSNILFFSLYSKNEKQKFVRCCLIYENSKEYCKRIMSKSIYYSLVLVENFGKNKKSNKHLNFFLYIQKMKNRNLFDFYFCVLLKK